ADQVGLADGEGIRPPIDLSRAGEHHLHAWIVPAAGLEHGELTAAVDFQIRVRIPHAVDMAHLTREVENHRSIADEIVHRGPLRDIRDVDLYAAGRAVDVEQVSAVVVDERIDEQDVGPELDQLAGQVAADEAEAAGDHYLAAAVERPVIRGHGW